MGRQGVELCECDRLGVWVLVADKDMPVLWCVDGEDDVFAVCVWE